MRKRQLWIGICAALMVVLGTSNLSAQLGFGFGAGLASAGNDIRRAAGDLSDLIQKDSIQYGDVSNGIGFYGTGRVKFSLGVVRFVGDASVVFFPASELTLIDYDANQNQTGSATFDVGALLVPLNVGVEFVIPTPVVRPYVGAELSYTYVSRTYTKVQQDESFTSDVGSKSAGDGEVGLSFGAGVDIALGPVALDVGARYNLSNLFTKSTGENASNYLQVGVALYFGDLE